MQGQTLADFKNHPLTVLRSHAEVPLSQTIDKVKLFLDHNTVTNPEADAIQFYMTNHVASLLATKYHPEEPMNGAELLASAYYEQQAIPVMRMFYYMLLICSRESRHAHKKESYMAALKDEFGKEILGFYKRIAGEGSSGAKHELLNNPPKTTLGEFTRYLAWCFNPANGKYSTQYGGEAWEAIAIVLNQFVQGESSAEMLMDTGWCLSHNNGPIFNKGMCYHGYGGDLMTILDVQRAGMIPQLVNDVLNHHHWVQHSFMTGETIKIFSQARSFFPEVFEAHVDWYLVEALGAEKTYHYQKQKQVEMFGDSEGAKEAKEKAEQLKKQQELAKAKAEAEKQAKSYFITPEVSVPKLTRQQVTAALAKEG